MRLEQLTINRNISDYLTDLKIWWEELEPLNLPHHAHMQFHVVVMYTNSEEAQS